eukprot:3373548-Alexandrium_andersonii.AAC.1
MGLRRALAAAVGAAASAVIAPSAKPSDGIRASCRAQSPVPTAAAWPRLWDQTVLQRVLAAAPSDSTNVCSLPSLCARRRPIKHWICP